ncbi:tRNA lysidine(34) synthetase TilS [soil metagenome]
MSHRPVAEVRLAVRTALTTLDAGDTFTVACSGGADSLALAAGLAVEAPRLGIRAGAVSVDHGLQDGSAARAHELAVRLTALGLAPVDVATVTVGGAGGPEGATRTARYAALEAVQVERGGWVALGHTLDDQAETVLLGLGRGSGARSMAGMAPARFPWLRPLLAVRRSTTRAACRALALEVWDDPHNRDPAYTRVRLRHEVLPLLEDVLNGGVAEALARTADLLRDDADALDGIVTGLAEQRLTSASPEVEAFADLVPALRRRLLRRWLTGHGVPALTAGHLRAVDALITGWRGQGAVGLPGGWEALRASGRLHLRATPPLSPRREQPRV